MANYVLVFRGGSVPETAEEQQKVMADWGAWFGGMGDKLVDGGNPFGASATVGPDGTVSEGAASALTGYTIIAADDLAAASEMSKSCPILVDGGGSIEVYETMVM